MNRHLARLILALVVALPWAAAAQQVEPPALFIEGYAGQLSYAPGDEVELHVSTSAEKYSLEVSRLGAETSVVMRNEGLAGASHPIPVNASSHGCQWPTATSFRIPPDWRSGYYEVNLQVRDGGGDFIHRNRRSAEGTLFFIVRSASPGANTKVLLQLSTNTYNAYNNWGGHSLYSYHDRDGLQGHRVSFDRPTQGQFRNWELPFVTWAEENGIEIDYAANSDLELRPELLASYRLILSVGHDEYWSSAMRDNLESFIGEGGNVAFFSGNTCCWQVRSEDGGRALTCWKQGYNLDPVFQTGDHRLLSTAWSHHLVKRPENQLTGVGFLFGGYHRSHGQFMDGSGAYTVHRPTHWVFEGTGLGAGDEFGGKDTIVGYECDGCEFRVEDGKPVPTHRDGTPPGFLILGSCPARWHEGDSQWYERFPVERVGAAVMGVYTRGGTVFTSGATDWAHGLRGKDPTVTQITKNLLQKLSQ